MGTPLEYEPSQFLPTEENVKAVKRLSGSIQDSIQSLKFNYTNFISGKFSNTTLQGICYSLSSRDTSISYHLNLLLEINQEAALYLDPININFAVNKKRYLFDSLIFNIVSAIDYCACLASYILIHKQAFKYPWQRYYKAILNSKSQSVREFAEKTKDINRWFILLNDYRAELIHYEADNVGHKSNTDFFTCRTKLTVYPPHAFQRQFKVFKKLPNDENKSIDAVSLWLISTYRTSVNTVIRLLSEYIKENKIGDFDILRIGNNLS